MKLVNFTGGTLYLHNGYFSEGAHCKLKAVAWARCMTICGNKDIVVQGGYNLTIRKPPLVKGVFLIKGGVEMDLPPIEEEVLYIVTRDVAAYCRRPDFVCEHFREQW